MQKKWFGLFLLLVASTGFSQSQFTLSGYVKDASNGETLIGATVYITELSTGAVANPYGFYSITLPEGNYSVSFQFVGFNTSRQQIQLNKDLRIDINLEMTGEILQEVTVSDKALDENIRGVEMSVAELDIKTIKEIPAFAGEVDIIKSIQMLPGVTAVGEGSSGFNVRGGSVGQNLILLDESPVYQSSHLFGFFSVFNPDAVKDVKLYKGGIPAQYGGRLASVLDIRMKEGNNKEFDVSGGLGTVFSRIAVEGPIKKEKSSFIVAARRSYGDLIAKALVSAVPDDAQLYFYDVTAKVNFNLNDKNRIYISGYSGRDVFKFDKFQGFDWGNRTATIRWNHINNERLFSNWTAFYSNYDYGFQIGENESDKYDWKSEISTFNLKPEYSWFINTAHTLNFGGEAILYQFKPATAATVSEGEATDISLDERRALELALFISSDHRFTDRFSVLYGLRFSTFSYRGGTVFEYGDTLAGLKKPLRSFHEADKWEAVQSWGNLEPRISMKYQVSKTAAIKASYNRMNQYIHLISNTTAATPIDIWQPSTNNIDPQQADQVATGYFKNLKENKYEVSVEAYYKWTRNQIDYIDGADLFINQYLESQLLSGRGRAYGVEFFAKKNVGKLTGWASYTLSKTEMKVDGINFGKDKINRSGDWYATRFDQRHNIKVMANYALSKKISLSANFSYLSGTPTTFPTDRITMQGYVLPHINGSARNNYRINDYHRLDVAVTFNNIWRGKKGRSGEDNFVISIYNLYARKNPFSIYFSQGNMRQQADSPIETSATQLAMLGSFIPSFSYNFKF